MDAGYILRELDEDGLDVIASGFDSEDESDISFIREAPLSEAGIDVPQRIFNEVCHTSLPVEVWERIMIHMSKDGIQTMSQVSHQHHAITKEVAFRSRYFLHQGMKCQAIFKASCFKKLFTSELLKCLLNMGAIMSRYFVHQFSLSHSGHHIRGLARWAEGLSTTVYLAVITEGVARYGDSLKLSNGHSDVATINGWVGHATRSLVIEDNIREIFVNGKFAPFTKEDYQVSSSLISSLISKHPDLVDMLEENGYTFTKSDCEGVISDIFQKNVATEEELYKKVDNLLTRFDHWKVGFTSCSHLLTRSFGSNFNPMPETDEGRRIIADNDGIGPVLASFKVMRRLYLEGKAFQDLDAKLVEHLEIHLAEPEYCHIHVAEYRLFYRHFPHLLQDRRQLIAFAYICAYQHKTSSATTATEHKNLRQSLFEMLQELNLDTADMAMVFSDALVTSKLLHHALKAGLFGSDWSQHIDKIIRTLINYCIDDPRTGARMKEIETVVIELHRVPVGKSKRDHKLITKGFFVQELHRILCSWAFDLDLLRPDRKHATEAKFRTPIGWFVSGGYRTAGSYHSYHCGSAFQDTYRLIPGAPPRSIYVSNMVETYFAHTQGFDFDYGGVEEDDEEEEVSVESDNVAQVHAESLPVGWTHLGHIDEITKAGDDSGVCMMDDVDTSKAMEAVSVEETTVMKSTDASKQVSNLKLGPKLGLYNTIPMRFSRTYCSKRDRDNYCNRSCPDRGEELAITLQEMLPADSPAMRDVLLSHALVNGNSPLVERLMGGDYAPEGEKTISKKKKIKMETGTSQTQASEASTTSTSVGKGPVLPTLAHLRILQVLERRPVSAFTNRIIAGAPFKRGYVKSSVISVRSKEEDEEKRWGWYKETGHKDDRPMIALYEEKARLEEVDAIAKQKARKKSAKAAAAKRRGRRSAVTRLETEDDEEEFSVVTDSSKVDSNLPSRPKRSCRKAIKYSEPMSNSSDVEDAIPVKKAGESSTKGQVTGFLDDGSDLSDVESDGGEEEDRIMQDGTVVDESETEREDDDVNEDLLGLGRKDVPKVEFEVGIDRYEMSLGELIRRSKSIKLWSEHLHLLEWFEKRKDKIQKDKLAKARKEQETRERSYKNDYYKWLEGFIKEVNALKEVMEVEKEKAVNERKISLARKKRVAILQELKKGDKVVEAKRGKVTKKKRSSETSGKEDKTREVESSSKGSKRKRGTGTNDDEDDDLEVQVVVERRGKFIRNK